MNDNLDYLIDLGMEYLQKNNYSQSSINHHICAWCRVRLWLEEVGAQCFDAELEAAYFKEKGFYASDLTKSKKSERTCTLSYFSRLPKQAAYQSMRRKRNTLCLKTLLMRIPNIGRSWPEDVSDNPLFADTSVRRGISSQRTVQPLLLCCQFLLFLVFRNPCQVLLHKRAPRSYMLFVTSSGSLLSAENARLRWRNACPLSRDINTRRFPRPTHQRKCRFY